MSLRETLFQGNVSTVISEGNEYYGGFSYLCLDENGTFVSAHGRGQSVDCSNNGKYELDEDKSEIVFTDIYSKSYKGDKIKRPDKRVRFNPEKVSFIMLDAFSHGKSLDKVDFEHITVRLSFPTYLPYIIDCEEDKYTKDFDSNNTRTEYYYISTIYRSQSLYEMGLDFDYVKQDYYKTYNRSIPEKVRDEIKTYLDTDIDFDLDQTYVTVYYDKNFKIIASGLFYKNERHKDSFIKINPGLKSYVKNSIDIYMDRELEDTEMKGRWAEEDKLKEPEEE